MIDELADPMRVMTSLMSLNRGNASNRRDKYSVSKVVRLEKISQNINRTKFFST